MAATITNKLAGNCHTCRTRVNPGKGVATKADGKWRVLCNSHKPETHGANNPWREQHMSAEMDYTGGEYTRSKARSLVNSEYQNTDEMSEPCDCGGTCYWRATVGARQCSSCYAMICYRWDKATNTMVRSVIK